MLMMVVKRMLIAVPSLIGVVIVTFLLTRALPGDPAAYFAGPAATKEAIEQIRVKLGLDAPLYLQFIRYVGDLARGDLGNSLTTGQPVGHEIKTRLPASAELTLLGLMVSMAIAVPLGILAATRPNSIIDHLCRVISTAGVSLPVFFTGLILIYVFYYLLGWAPAPLGRLDVFFSPPPHVTGFYLIDSLIAGDGEVFVASLKQLVLPALTHTRHLLARADRAHDARLHARRARIRLRAHRARERACALHRGRHLRLPQRHAPGRHHARYGVFLPARRQRAGREGVRLARHRFVRGRGADRVGFCAAAGLRAHHGGDVCRAQPLDRRALRPDRSAREDRGMSNIALPNEASAERSDSVDIRAPSASADARERAGGPGSSARDSFEARSHSASEDARERADDTRPQLGSSARAMLRHARYILGENAVTGFAFALFLVIVLAVLLGPYLVPYDPLASDTAAALKAPSGAHWFGTDQLGRDVFSRVVVATRLDFFIAVSSVALVFLMGGLAGVAAGFFGGWTDRVVGREIGR